MRHRTSYGTFTLRGDKDGVVHLEGGENALPEVIAIGISAVMEFRTGEPPLGGPHADFQPPTDTRPARLHITTPEAEFTYEVFASAQDADGWYYLWRLTFTSSTYHAFLAGH